MATLVPTDRTASAARTAPSGEIAAPLAPASLPPARPARFAVLRHVGPNWYASVMGTAIVASAGATLPTEPLGLASPMDVPVLRAACVTVWAVSALMLLLLLTARAGHWIHHRDQARAHLLDPSVAPFYGCLAMALLAVGGATLTVGRHVIGESAAVTVDAVLFTAGTLVGLAAAVAVPYLMVVRHRVRPGDASPVWLLPVVAPMVSAALGPGLIPYLPAGQWREALLLACYAMFGMSLLATLTLLPLIFGRLVTYGPLPLALTPATDVDGSHTDLGARLTDLIHGWPIHVLCPAGIPAGHKTLTTSGVSRYVPGTRPSRLPGPARLPGCPGDAVRAPPARRRSARTPSTAEPGQPARPV